MGDCGLNWAVERTVERTVERAVEPDNRPIRVAFIEATRAC
jgi:hypothetical protein